MERTETVYVAADADGTPRNAVSSVYIENPDGRDVLTDNSNLVSIKNVLSNESPVKNGDGWLFHTDGDNLCYQGDGTTENLPVLMRVSYSLDGKKVSKDEINGASGHVRVTVSYENRIRKLREVNGENVALYVPFTVVTMLTVPENFENLSVSDARLMNDAGSRTVLGITFPGLAKNLETEATGKLSERFSVEADTECFSLESVTAVVVPNLMSSKDLDDMNDLDDFVNGVDELNDAGDELEKGGRKLYKGLKKYAEGTEELRKAVKQLKEAAELLTGTDIRKATARIRSVKSNASDGISKIQSANQILKELDTSAMDPEQQEAIELAISNLNSAQSDLSSIREEARSFPDLNTILEELPILQIMAEMLDEGAQTLVSGAVSLRKGAWALYKGIRDFNNDGLSELESQTETLTLASERKEAILDLGEEYTAYSLNKGSELGSVRFVYTTDAIYHPQKVKISGEIAFEPETVTTEKTPNFFESVIQFFQNLFHN